MFVICIISQAGVFLRRFNGHELAVAIESVGRFSCVVDVEMCMDGRFKSLHFIEVVVCIRVHLERTSWPANDQLIEIACRFSSYLRI